MFDNQKLRWDRDNGVYLPMIEDSARNQFYDNVFAKTVKNKNCIDVGFGTGLLSLLALKHGATHITAYECDYNRFQLGKHIISHLGLETKITLINKLFTPADAQSHHELLFHETIDPNLWSDGVFGILPTPVPIIPCTYSCDFYLVEITPGEHEKITNSTAIAAEDEEIWQNFYHSIKGVDWPLCPPRHQFDQLPDWIKDECANYHCSYTTYGIGRHTFDPGVEIDINYKKEIQRLINNYYELPKNKKVYDLGSLPKDDYRGYINRGQLISWYEFDSDEKQFSGSEGMIQTDNLVQLVVPHSLLVNKTTLILSNYKIKSHGYELDLSLAHDACWVPPRCFGIVQDPVGPLTIQQCLRSGDVQYWIE